MAIVMCATQLCPVEAEGGTVANFVMLNFEGVEPRVNAKSWEFTQIAGVQPQHQVRTLTRKCCCRLTSGQICKGNIRSRIRCISTSIKLGDLQSQHRTATLLHDAQARPESLRMGDHRYAQW